MQIENLRDGFENFVASFLVDQGYEKRKSERLSFSKKNDGNEFRIDFQVIKKVKRYEILPEIFISQRDISRIYSECTTNELNAKWTLYGRLLLIDSYFHEPKIDFRKRNSKWQLRNEENLKQLVHSIPIYFDETVLKFFEKNTVEEIDKELNDFPREDSIFNSLYPIRGNVGLIAGKIVGRENLQELYNIYNERIHLSPEEHQLERRRVWNYLEENF